jgi:glutathione S-transferase
MADALTLHIGNKNYSSWSMRPWLCLRQVGVPFREELIALDQPDTAARLALVSPSGRVPVLVHGTIKIWESLSICEYLAETFPEAQLWPKDPRARAVARSVSHEMHGGFSALRSAMSMNLRKRTPRAATPEVARDIARISLLWRECRSSYGQGGPFLFGGFTIADAMYAPVVSRFRTYDVATGELETAYRKTVEALPAYADWAASAAQETWELPGH